MQMKFLSFLVHYRNIQKRISEWRTETTWARITMGRRCVRKSSAKRKLSRCWESSGRTDSREICALKSRKSSRRTSSSWAGVMSRRSGETLGWAGTIAICCVRLTTHWMALPKASFTRRVNSVSLSCFLSLTAFDFYPSQHAHKRISCVAFTWLPFRWGRGSFPLLSWVAPICSFPISNWNKLREALTSSGTELCPCPWWKSKRNCFLQRVSDGRGKRIIRKLAHCTYSSSSLAS